MKNFKAQLVAEDAALLTDVSGVRHKGVNQFANRSSVWCKSEAGRIVNMSSGLGFLTDNSDPNWEYAGVKPPAYNSSKAALNMLTVIFAAKLKGTPIKVNAAAPGCVAQGATVAIHLATLPADGPTGGYFDENGPVPW